MKLIDVLVMISKGELKEGTKIVWKETAYTYDGNDLMDEEDDYSLFDFVIGKSLNEEVELIAPEQLRESTKNIEELDIEFKDVYVGFKDADAQVIADIIIIIIAVSKTRSKLNEVIRELNRRSE